MQTTIRLSDDLFERVHHDEILEGRPRWKREASVVVACAIVEINLTLNWNSKKDAWWNKIYFERSLEFTMKSGEKWFYYAEKSSTEIDCAGQMIAKTSGYLKPGLLCSLLCQCRQFWNVPFRMEFHALFQCPCIWMNGSYCILCYLSKRNQFEIRAMFFFVNNISYDYK